MISSRPSAHAPLILLATVAALAALAPPLTAWAFPDRPWLTGPLSALASGWFWPLAAASALLQTGLLVRPSPWPARVTGAAVAALVTTALLAAAAELVAPTWFSGRLTALLGQSAWHGVPGVDQGLNLLDRGLEAVGLRERSFLDRLPEGSLPLLGLLAGLWLFWLAVLAKGKGGPAAPSRRLLPGGAAVLVAAVLAHPLARERGLALAGTGTFAALAAGAWAVCLALVPDLIPDAGRTPRARSAGASETAAAPGAAGKAGKASRRGRSRKGGR